MTPIHAPLLPDPEGQVRSTSAESEAPVAARHPIIYNLFPTWQVKPPAGSRTPSALDAWGSAGST